MVQRAERSQKSLRAGSEDMVPLPLVGLAPNLPLMCPSWYCKTHPEPCPPIRPRHGHVSQVVVLAPRAGRGATRRRRPCWSVFPPRAFFTDISRRLPTFWAPCARLLFTRSCVLPRPAHLRLPAADERRVMWESCPPPEPSSSCPLVRPRTSDRAFRCFGVGLSFIEQRTPALRRFESPSIFPLPHSSYSDPSSRYRILGWRRSLRAPLALAVWHPIRRKQRR